MTDEQAERYWRRWSADLTAAKLDGYASDGTSTWLWKGRYVVAHSPQRIEGWDHGARNVARRAFGLATLDVAL